MFIQPLECKGQCKHVTISFNNKGDACFVSCCWWWQEMIYHKPDSKCQNMEYTHLMSPVKKKIKSDSPVGKLMVSLSWDLQGPIHEHYQEGGVMINNAHYMTYCMKSSSWWSTLNADNCQKMLCCCITMFIAIGLPTLLGHWICYALKSYNIQHTTITFLHQIIICLDPTVTL
jgi:hypothetical protein